MMSHIKSELLTKNTMVNKSTAAIRTAKRKSQPVW